jgi:purine-binding chemotaxis protein CheW
VAASRLFCTFSLGDELFGLDVEHVREVLRPQPITRVTLAPRTIRGLINLRGEIVMAIDLRECLELGPSPPGVELMNIVARTAEGPISLLADRAHDVVEVNERFFEPTPRHVRGPSAALIRGTYAIENKQLMVLDLPAILALLESTPPPPSVNQP